MADQTHRTTLPNGTVIAVEDNGGCPMVHVLVSKGKYHRAIPLFRAEAVALAELLVKVSRDS